MILPTKRLSEDRALIQIGGEILELLTEPKTVSRLWNEMKKMREKRPDAATLTYDWFVLALDLLYIINAIDFKDGRIRGTFK